MRRTFPLAITLSILAVSAGGIGAGVSSCARTRPPPNVLVLLLDTLRADHVGAYGYERATSPNIDGFARENVRFTRAFATVPWTPPSVASLFSGLYATSHGMMPTDDLPNAEHPSRRLDDEVVTLAEILEGAGYRTAAVSSNPWITPEFGYGQGFGSFDVKVEARADAVTDLGLARIEELRAKPDPFFVYLHYLDPHAPYEPPKEHLIFEGGAQGTFEDPRTAKSVDRYDGEIHYLDASLGRLFAGLRAKGLYDDLVIVLLGDHGEQFGEHGHLGHGWQLFNEELRVPLVVKPGRAEKGRTIDRVVSIVDVLPTILARAGVSAPAGLPGVSLFDDAGLAARRGVFAEIERKLSLRAYVNAAGKKLIVERKEADDESGPSDPVGKIAGLFDADARAEPRIEDASLERELWGEFLATLDRVTRSRITPVSNGVVPSAETIERLKALGYVK